MDDFDYYFDNFTESDFAKVIKIYFYGIRFKHFNITMA